MSQQPTPYDAALTCDNIPFYDALAEHDDDNLTNIEHALNRPSASTLAALASALPNIYSYETCPQQPVASIEKYVNPLGTVTTITAGMTTELKTDILDEVVSQLAAEETVIHENCDEALFRPVVAIFCDEEMRKRVVAEEEIKYNSEFCKPPEVIGSNLVVPVIAKELDAEICKREKAKNYAKSKQQLQKEQWQKEQAEKQQFEKLSLLNKKPQENEEKILDKKEEATNNKSYNKSAAKLSKNETNIVTAKSAKEIKTKPIISKTTTTTALNKNKPMAKEKEIKTENLQMSALTDSLKELSKDEIEEVRQVEEEEEENVNVLELLEPIDLYSEQVEKAQQLLETHEKTMKNIEKKTKKREEIIKEENKNENREIEKDLEKNIQTKVEEIYEVKILETQIDNIEINKTENHKKSNIKNENSSEESSYKVKVIETNQKGSNEKTIKIKNEELKTTETLKSPTKKQKTLTKNVESAWKNLSGAEMINKSLKSTEITKSDTKKEDKVEEKKIEKKKQIEDFPVLEPLECLPPLPDLEPLELITVEMTPPKANAVTLINFESPLLENVVEESKKTTYSSTFNKDNVILALCGSLHYENEMNSLTRCSTSLGEQSIDSLTENDEQYISFEQNLLETNNNNVTNERFSYSSEASSASEEIIIMEEKKMSKRQKRKLQKNKKDIIPQLTRKELETDEELRPLIDNNCSGMSDSQAESVAETYENCNMLQTTTDSEGPLPATTSDDNAVFVTNNLHLHKIKTKKLEHKINLIGAIEAATSSSTSSAEESGIETITERRASLDLESPSCIPITSGATSMPLLTLPTTVVSSTVVTSNINGGLSSNTPNGGTKKKTKRRKR